MRSQYDAFWFPASIRNAIIMPDTEYDSLYFRDGSIVADSDGDGSVMVRWPRLDLDEWQWVVNGLRGNRERIQTNHWRERLPKAIHQMQDLWVDQDDSLRKGVLEALSICTGHSAAMLDLTLSLLDLVSIDDLQRAVSCPLTHAVKGEFVSLDGLAGKLRFFGEKWWQNLTVRAMLRCGSYRRRPWRLRPRSTELILGFAAGNVPGTGLLLVLLGLAAAASEGLGPPLIIVKNSRREPLFTPLVLSALELVDPVLVDTTVVTLWDYTDPALQEYLISQADLVVAAASDESIDRIGQTVDRVKGRSRPIHFHRHGHKVSFSTLGRECLEVGREEPERGVPLLDVVALLASLDVALWNQQGCLSSRVHFVEMGHGEGYHLPEAYGEAVVKSLRLLNSLIPKGVSRKRQVHNLFDKYQAVALGGGDSGEISDRGLDRTIKVLSEYDDDFVVVLDQRSLTADQFREVINDCQGRTVFIIPVDNAMEVPRHYLKQIRRTHLQSMSVALGDPDRPEIDPRLMRYAEALGAVGITGIRTVGRGAFPQLAYSWDGFVPLDLVVERPPGHFTAIEFDQPWVQIFETYRLIGRMMDLEKEWV